MEFRILGPLEVCSNDGAVLPFRGATQRMVLAGLLVRANQVVPLERLVD